MALAENTPVNDLLIKAVEHEIARQTEKLISEATKDIEREMQRRTPEIIAGITVAMMRMTQYAVLQDRIVFTIMTEEKKS